MARIRSIKPEFATSLAIADLSHLARLHFILLWTYADDEGRGVDDPRLLKAALWPLDESVSLLQVDELQAELCAHGRIRRYESGGRCYFEVVNWAEHQKPQHPRKSTLPPSGEASRKPHEDAPDQLEVVHEDVPPQDDPSGTGGEGRGGELESSSDPPKPPQGGLEILNTAESIAIAGCRRQERTIIQSEARRHRVAEWLQKWPAMSVDQLAQAYKTGKLPESVRYLKAVGDGP